MSHRSESGRQSGGATTLDRQRSADPSDSAVSLAVGVKLTPVDSAPERPVAPLSKAEIDPSESVEASRPESTPAPRITERAPARLLTRPTVLGLFGLLLIVNLAGVSYYVQDAAERVRNPLHPWLKPTGYIGQTVGILSLVFFIFLWLYPLRKKFARLTFTGPIARWLDVHIVLGLLVPALATMHAAWRFDGLIGVGYLAMLLVSASGVVGRYIYTRIPRSRSGVELGIDEVRARREDLVRRIATTTGLDPQAVKSALSSAVDVERPRGLVASFTSLVSADLARWKAVRELRRAWAREGRAGGGLDNKTVRDAIRLARRQIALTQQGRLLDASHRVFRFWHVAHRPIAVTALIAVVVHVAVAIGLGVTWLW